jgi:two-component system, cell cycle response regulator
MRILIAEDDRTSALVLKKALEKMGYDVIVANDGVTALSQIDQFGVNLVISDWMMPEMDGLDLCRQLRGPRAGGYVYVILLTARGGREDRLAAFERGADDFLVKPLDRAELHARLHVARRILAMQDELKERQAQLERMHAALEQKNERLAEMAITDELTGLKNRRHFMEVLQTSFDFAVRQNQPLSLVMLDVDNFKLFNDSFGHPAGDRVLRDVARSLHLTSRSYDLVARYGGEEFAVLLPAADHAASRVHAERMRAEIAALPWPLRPVTASFGVASLSPETLTPLELLAQADQALYRSKERGRNVVTSFEDIMNDKTALITAPTPGEGSCPRALLGAPHP